MNIKFSMLIAFIAAFLLSVLFFPQTEKQLHPGAIDDSSLAKSSKSSGSYPPANYESIESQTKISPQQILDLPPAARQKDNLSTEPDPTAYEQDTHHTITPIPEDSLNVDKTICAKLKSEITDMAKADPAFQELGFWLTDPDAKHRIDYHSYTVDQLIPLAENGDRNAQHVLGEKLAITSPDKAKQWLKEAAINGYTNSLISLSRVTASQYYMTKHNIAAQEKASPTTIQHKELQKIESYLIEMLAWTLVAKKRLGSGGKIDNVQFEDHQYTADEILAAEQKASELYNSLEAERLNRGLGHFENYTFAFTESQKQLFALCSKQAWNEHTP
jgi:hypothetical protein